MRTLWCTYILKRRMLASTGGTRRVRYRRTQIRSDTDTVRGRIIVVFSRIDSERGRGESLK